MGVLCYSLRLLFLTLFATATLFITALNGEPCTYSEKSTHLIVFGDSFFVRDNNDELCLQSGHEPYGNSLDQKVPTGRFSDGLVVPDYIAKYLGLADHEDQVAAPKCGFAIQQTSQRKGKGYARLNFAMAGARISQCLKKSKSLADQVRTFLENPAKCFASSGGCGGKFPKAPEQPLYLFSIGTYDYLAELKNIRNERDVEVKAERVTTAIVEQVEKIAEHQAVNGERFAFMSVALRYLPVVQKIYSQNETLLNLIDKLETTHHSKLAEKLQTLAETIKTKSQDHIINYSILQYHSIINAIMEQPEKYGYNKTTVTSACCGDGSYRADGCGDLDKKGCNDPTAYVFWDGMHNTQHINQEIARRFWNGPTGLTSPQNLQTLAGTHKTHYDFSVNANELIITSHSQCVKTQVTWTEEKVTSILSN